MFVATAKLSAPTVGVGVTSRPSSVASSGGGPITPSYSSGRVTPSNSARYTPYSNGRVTPASSTSLALLEAVTPSARPRIKTATTPFNGNVHSVPVPTQVSFSVRIKAKRESYSRACEPKSNICDRQSHKVQWAHLSSNQLCDLKYGISFFKDPKAWHWGSWFWRWRWSPFYDAHKKSYILAYTKAKSSQCDRHAPTTISLPWPHCFS